MPRIDTALLILTALSTLSTILTLFVPYRYIISFSTIGTIVIQIILAGIGSYSWLKGNPSSRLFVFSWCVLIVGAASFALLALGAIPRNFLTEWMQEIGFGAMVILMIIAQFDRFLQIQKGHESNQIKSLEAVQNAEKKYRSLFENAIEGIFQMDNKGVLTNVNNSFANILGIDDPELLVETRDTPFTLGFMSESEGAKLEAMLNSQGSLNDYNISFASPTGEIRWASIAMQKVQGSNINDYRYEGSLTDITETKKREQAEKQRRMAEASTEAKSMFLANMSHEIRTPMNAIIGFTDLAVNANQDKNLAEFLRKIKTASSNLLGIINDILDFSKIEAGKLKIESIPFNLRELMSNIEDIVEGNIESKGLEFSIDIDEDIPEVLIGDSLRLHQILLNLTNNAVKFTPEGSVKVEIDLLAMNKKKGTIKLAGRVIDTGIGISQEKQNKLFTSFSQADESTTRTFGGTGLGLSISKQLISMMGGDISVRSIENQGSVFEFNFQCRLESRSSRIGSKNPKLNVLIIDDNNDSRLLTESVISDLNHTFTSVNSTDEALHVLKASQDDNMTYDLLLIDWLMPGSDGFDCRKQIKALPGFELPKTALITTYGEEGLKERALNEGFDGYIEKPLRKAHIQQIIASIFGSTPSPSQKKTTVKANASSERQDQESHGLAFKGVKALVVEDVSMNQELAREILKKQGIATTIASDGEQGVEAAKQQTFDVILMDMQMPIMDGCEATLAIREFDENIPIIAMTANAMAEDRKRCLSVGMNDFVTKPINDKELFSTLAKYVKPLDQSESDEHDTNGLENCAFENNELESTELESDAFENSQVEDYKELSVNSATPSPTPAPLDEPSPNDADELVIASDQLALEIQNAETPKAAKLPESLPSIDLQDGLERCQGNQKLYLKLLGDFIRNYGASAAQMKTMLETGDLDSLAKLAHTLKGLSANLGAKTLSTQAMQLEHIADIRDNEQAGAIEEFSLVLTTLTQELESLLKTMQESDQNQDVQVRCFSNEERKVFLESLAGMINEQKMDAYDQAVEAAEKWPDDLAKDELNQLIEQLDLFEFDSAKQSLENIKSMIQ